MVALTFSSRKATTRNVEEKPIVSRNMSAKFLDLAVSGVVTLWTCFRNKGSQSDEVMLTSRHIVQKLQSINKTCHYVPKHEYSRHSLSSAVFPTSESMGSLNMYSVFPGATQEHRYLPFFQQRTVPEISAIFDQGLWNRLLLQVIRSEPAIRYSVFALSWMRQSIDQRGLKEGI